MDFYGFYRGQEFEAYEYLGAHFEGDTVVFRTFAPAARSIAVIGEFNGWTETPMYKVYDGNFWECRVDGACSGQMYKYRICTQDGRTVDHCDPYGAWAELRPGSASKLYRSTYSFQDAGYLKKPRDYAHEPMNIYELQAGAWRLPDPSDCTRHYTYRELADLLVPYLKQKHYNYLEMMPITEFPCDESWGYQTTGFFAPTSRYGTPDDLRCLIDRCHAEGIGVILDFVAVHFASNDYALLRYDGTSLYEYPSNDVGVSEWGTCNFMHSRGEVRSFLQSSVYYWMKEFHFDGVRVDAVSNLLYWQGDPARGVNQSSVQFLRTMNEGLKTRLPNALLIAEDSSTYPGVTRAVCEGGLGFDFKWDLGWMNDTLSYMQAYPVDRKNIYHKLTFSIHYFYNEKYLLPLSHDEVVHGKATIVQKMNGSDLDGKFRQVRVLYAYMYAHPGKKLNFMGNELGGIYEWSEKKEIDWWFLRDERHALFHDFMQALCALYDAVPALWAEDYERDGFEWTDCANEGKCAVYSFVRRGCSTSMLAVFNFGDGAVEGYSTRLPERDLSMLKSSGVCVSESADCHPCAAGTAGAACYDCGAGALSPGTAVKIFDSNWKRFGGDIEEGTPVKPVGDGDSDMAGIPAAAVPISADGVFTDDLPGFCARFYLLVFE